MTEQTTEERVKKVICDQLGVESEQVTPEAHFVNDLGADSLDQVELVMAFEEEFGLEISDDEAQKLDTVAKVVEYVKNKTGEH